MEYLSGSKHYAAPDMRLVSLRYEDLVQDLEIEVISWLCTVCTQHACMLLFISTIQAHYQTYYGDTLTNRNYYS